MTGFSGDRLVTLRALTSQSGAILVVGSAFRRTYNDRDRHL